MPIDCKDPLSLKLPFTPTTAFNFKSVSVVAGSFKLAAPDLIADTTVGGKASASTFRPTAKAVLGLTPVPKPPFADPAIALSICSNPLQNDSSPKASKRNI